MHKFKKVSRFQELTADTQSEAKRLYDQLASFNAMPLSDRQAARKYAIEHMKTPDMISRNIGWLFDGSYGAGAYYHAWRMLSLGNGFNKVSGICQLTVALDTNCPVDWVRQAWHELTSAEQKALDNAVISAIETAIDDYLKESKVKV